MGGILSLSDHSSGKMQRIVENSYFRAIPIALKEMLLPRSRVSSAILLILIKLNPPTRTTKHVFVVEGPKKRGWECYRGTPYDARCCLSSSHLDIHRGINALSKSMWRLGWKRQMFVSLGLPGGVFCGERLLNCDNSLKNLFSIIQHQ